MKASYEEKRFASILKELNANINWTKKDKHHPIELDLGIISNRIKSTIPAVLKGAYKKPEDQMTKSEAQNQLKETLDWAKKFASVHHLKLSLK